METKIFGYNINNRITRQMIRIERDRGTLNQRALNGEVARICNRYLIDLGLNDRYWCREYGNRVFIYDTRNRRKPRAVVEVGIIGEITDAGVRWREVHLMGGIYNKRMPRELW